MEAEKLDLTKLYSTYYSAKATPGIVELKEGLFLSIEGRGSPDSKEFTSTVEALYSLAYGVKMPMKQKGRDFSVAKLEGLWWVDSGKDALKVPREEWQWKLLIRMPDFITSQDVEKAKGDVIKKKGIEMVKEIKFERIAEGKCIQMMHVGPYSTEPQSLAKMKKHMEDNGLIPNGLHHEIYLSDPRRVPEEKMKTILRQPVKQK